LLPRVQRVFRFLALAGLLTALVSWTFAPNVPASRSWPVLPALAWLALRCWLLPRTRRELGLDVLSGLAMLCVVWAVGPGPANAPLYVTIMLRSMYGRLPGVVFSVTLQIAALAGGLAAAGGPVPSVDFVNDVVGLCVVGGAAYVLASSLRKFEASAEARFAALVRNSTDVFMLTDAETRVSYVSPALEPVFGHSEVPGGKVLTWVWEADRDQVQEDLDQLLANPGGMRLISCQVLAQDTELRHVEMGVQNALHDPQVQGLIINVRDVTARVRLTEQLRHRALHDPLTGLPNRALFAEQLDYALAQRASGGVAVLLIDLDKFKTVNDTHGHAAGDDVLVSAAARLRSCLRPGDSAARLGGDEFAVLVSGLPAGEEDSAQAVGARLLTALQEESGSPGEVHVGASIGIAMATPGMSPREVQHRADIALYRAKAAGRGRFELYRHAASEVGSSHG